MKLPKTILIGPQQYKVVPRGRRWQGKEGAYGQIETDDQTIDIVVEGLSPENVINTLIHEVFHGIWNAGHLEDKDEEERIVSVLATGFVAVLRNNPEFVRTINRSLKAMRSKDE